MFFESLFENTKNIILVFYESIFAMFFKVEKFGNTVVFSMFYIFSLYFRKKKLF